MGWVVSVPKEHFCSLPMGVRKGSGSIWQCDECGQMWKLRRYMSHSGEYTHKEWNKIAALESVIVHEKPEPKGILEILGLR